MKTWIIACSAATMLFGGCGLIGDNQPTEEQIREAKELWKKDSLNSKALQEEVDQIVKEELDKN